MRGITYDEWLMRRARTELKRDGVLSTSTAFELARRGFDVDAVENQITNELAAESAEEENDE